MSYTVKQSESGAWCVMDGGSVVSEHNSNRSAWRAAEAITPETDIGRPSTWASVAAEVEDENRQPFFSALLTIADSKGRKEGWAAHMFKAKYGVWPDDMLYTRGPVHPSVSFWLMKRSKR